MINLKNVQPMTEFKAKSSEFLGKLRADKSPLLLTINGKAACVVQDPESYQKTQQRLDSLETENERLKLDALRAAVEKWGLQQAREYRANLERSVERLAENPTLLGRSRHEIRRGFYSYHAEKHFFIFRMTDRRLQTVACR